MGPDVDGTVFIVGFLAVAVLLVYLGWMEKKRGEGLRWMGEHCDECGIPIQGRRYAIHEPHDLKLRELCKPCYEKALVRLFGYKRRGGGGRWKKPWNSTLETLLLANISKRLKSKLSDFYDS